MTTDAADMRETFPDRSINKGGLTNSDKVIVLYIIGMASSDLVQDVDYIIYEGSGGSINEQVDKSGVSIDGPDTDSSPTAYLDDTPIAIASWRTGPWNWFAAHRIDFKDAPKTQVMAVAVGRMKPAKIWITFIAGQAPTHISPPATLSLNAPLHSL